MLTTTDNPYDPWTEEDLWLEWDILSGYNTLQYVARIYSILNPNEEDGFNEELYNQAMQEILEQNITGNYVLVPEPAQEVV